MSSRRKLPSGLRAQAAKRTDDAVLAVTHLVAALKEELKGGQLVQGETLDLKAFQRRAGVNEKFLYGKKHRGSLKLEVEAVIDQVNAKLAQEAEARAEDTPLSRATEEAEYWKARHNRLASRANEWHHARRLDRRTIQDQAQQIRELSATIEQLRSKRPL